MVKQLHEKPALLISEFAANQLSAPLLRSFFSLTICRDLDDLLSQSKNQIWDLILISEEQKPVWLKCNAASLLNNCSVLILVASKPQNSLIQFCIASGILIAAAEHFPDSIVPALTMLSRIQSLEHRNSDLQQRLDDTRLVNRAKLLLITNLKMSESEAHRYIEKAAMNSGAKRRDIAIGIIKTYES